MKIIKTVKYVLSIIMMYPLISISQDMKRTITWYEPVEEQIKDAKQKFIIFDNSIHDFESGFPYYVERFENLGAGVEFELADYTFAPFEHSSLLPANAVIPASINAQTIVSYNRKQPVLRVKFLPFRKNQNGQIEKLISFTLKQKTANRAIQPIAAGNQKFADHSVLANGTWYKVTVNKEGVYRMDYDFIKRKFKTEPESIDPSLIKIYNNGGGMLPFSNSVARADDLQEIAIETVGMADGKFDKEDYILFYSQDPVRWKLSNTDNRYHHQLHLYSDSVAYFVMFEGNAGKRIATIANSGQLPNTTITTYDDYQYFEEEKTNFIKSGRDWYGRQFDVDPEQTVMFDFSNLNTSEPAYLRTEFAARTFNTDVFFDVSYNNTPINKLKVNLLFSNYLSNFCKPTSDEFGNVIDKTFNVQQGPIPIKMKFTRINGNANGWLDYLEINVSRNLIFSQSYMPFRSKQSAGLGKVSAFKIANVQGTTPRLWDVTRHNEVQQQQYSNTGGIAEFVAATDTLRQYILFIENAILEPTYSQVVANQDIHGQPIPKMVIVAHPEFVDEANRLAEFHLSHDGITTLVVSTTEVYNEFSSGVTDVSAIRDMLRMFYKRATQPSEIPKYLLLFGDGSYDNKNNEYKSGNFLPTFQSKDGCSFVSSFVTDDFFGLLDDDEGEVDGTEEVDIGIGRFPVINDQQAATCVDKVINYSSKPSAIIEEAACNNNATTPLGDWRNTLCFIGDDEDGVTHVKHADKMALIAAQKAPAYLQDKIYFDSFEQISTPGGERYPAVKDAITKRVERGALLMNYAGHGGETGWSEERVLEVSDIRSWKNVNRLPIFVTATCEFSRHDDPGRISAGELVLINGEGGGIGLFTTSRVAFTTSNETLNTYLIQSFFNFSNGKPTLGEVMRYTKALASDNANRNFTLLGDPAVVPAYPQYNMSITEINGKPVQAFNDTLKAMSLVTMKGKVTDLQGQLLSNYKGVAYPTIYDKSQIINNLINDPRTSSAFSFSLRKNSLYKGKAEIKNGEFQFSFYIPKDIDYNVGLGRVNLYAQDGSTDAQGYYDSILVGAINKNPPADNKGPDIKLYMNNEQFNSGGTTNENPSIYAVLSDEYGINTVGTGVGHDLSAILDNDNQTTYTLNDYYQADLNKYNEGKVIYPLYKLSTGSHNLKLRAWDIFNNSSEAKIDFVVAENASLALNHVFNYPNPFTTRTKFMFDHNQACNTITVEVKIFTVSGKVVKEFNQIVNCEGYNQGIEWDGRDEFGDQLARGVYLYKLKVSNLDGKTAEKIEKLVLLK
ncbi:MAG: type IX secretion system sortase PorU [Bacteroidetes bacterium]|nr:type IX secretion system sortase PorU [Bacteroidota bacterium]